MNLSIFWFGVTKGIGEEGENFVKKEVSGALFAF
jgi:hypothetical protein